MSWNYFIKSEIHPLPFSESIFILNSAFDQVNKMFRLAAPRFIYLSSPVSIRTKVGKPWREVDESRHGGTEEDLPRGPNLVSAKKRRIRRMSGNYASKSALDREESLLDDSDPAKGGTAWATPFITTNRGPGGRAVAWPHKRPFAPPKDGSKDRSDC
jgi:hypothetical protein